MKKRTGNPTVFSDHGKVASELETHLSEANRNLSAVKGSRCGLILAARQLKEAGEKFIWSHTLLLESIGFKKQ